MKKFVSFLITYMLLTFLLPCCKQIDSFTKVTLHIENSYNQKIFIEDILGPQFRKIDSAFIKERVEEVHFNIRSAEEGLYQLRSADSRLKLFFITDRNQILINADYLNPDDYSVQGSSATISLQKFIKKMQVLDTTVNARVNYTLLQQACRDYVDSVSSPAAALYVYNAIDFGNNKREQKEIITRLGKKFSGHSKVLWLKMETENYLSIFDEEYNIGDRAPELVLTDVNDQQHALISFKGKYILLDFWASWCGPCRMESSYKLKAYKKYKDRNFTIISVGLEPNRQQWLTAIKEDGYIWPQFIDDKVWEGPAVSTYKFDSIPFNFLIDADGIIIAKALYKDSLLKKLDQLFK